MGTVIPDDAVEAAWKVYVYSERVGLDVIRNMLEVAMPHLMAANAGKEQT